jgi:DNA-binding GntR family transcriptional regulator
MPTADTPSDVDPETHGPGPPPDGQVALARDRLRGAIVSGDLAAGRVISQPELSELLGVGRTPLREAIRLLAQDGLVLSERNRRVRIAELSLDDLEDLYALRLSVEAAAIRMTVPFLTPEQDAELDGLVAQMEHYSERGDAERFEIPHRAFHALLVSGAGNRMRAAARSLSDHAERYRRAYLGGSGASEASRSEHAQILASALDHDGDACAEQVIDHYARTAEAVAAAIGSAARPGGRPAGRVRSLELRGAASDVQR